MKLCDSVGSSLGLSNSIVLKLEKASLRPGITPDEVTVLTGVALSN